MLIAEDLLLLLTDDEKGKLVTGAGEADAALAGALLVELTLAGRVDLSRPGERDKAGRVVVRDAATCGDPVLDRALRELQEREGDKPSSVLGPLGKGLRKELYARLAERGLLRLEEGRVLFVFPTESWPAEDAAHEAEVRARLVGALQAATTPDPRTGALVALLHALRLTPKVVGDATGLGRKEVEARAEAVGQGGWASDAVRRAVEEMAAAVMTAVTVATTAATVTTT